MDAAMLELITVVKRLNATSVDSSDIFNTISSRLDIINQCIQLKKALVTLLSVNDTAFRNLSSIPEEPVVDSSKPGSDNHLFDEGVDSTFNTVIALIIFVVSIGPLIIRSTRGGVCEQFQVPDDQESLPAAKAPFLLNTTQAGELRRSIIKQYMQRIHRNSLRTITDVCNVEHLIQFDT